MPKKNTYKTKSVPPLKKGFARTTISLPVELTKLWKHRAVDEGRSYTEVAHDALTAYLVKDSGR